MVVSLFFSDMYFLRLIPNRVGFSETFGYNLELFPVSLIQFQGCETFYFCLKLTVGKWIHNSMEEIMAIIGYTFLASSNLGIIILTLINDISFPENATITNKGPDVDGNDLSLNKFLFNRFQPVCIPIKFEKIIEIDE